MQRSALRWMLEREKEAGLLPDPTWRPFPTKDGLPLWGCAASGDLRTEAPLPVRDIRGGFFCDEPVRIALYLRDVRIPARLPSQFSSSLMCGQ